ncbi:MAG: hypothetical protein IOD12_18560 [Silvanigrellales bacterium]|jgi:hypothetical protein|nr:hypothetical protein [Silvanigrellales bacterium]
MKKKPSVSLFAAMLATTGVLASGLGACGKSLYAPAANKDTDEARKEAAIIALDDDDYKTASENMAKLWESDPSNENAQLYAISLLGVAGFSLFDVVKDALSSTTSDAKESSAGNAILDKITDVVGTDVTESQLDIIRTAIDVLSAAPDQTSAGLKFQKCLTAGIYAAPTLGGLSEKLATLNSSLQTLPTRLGATGAACSASASEVTAIGDELTEVISGAALLAARVKEIEEVIGECLPAGSTEAVNTITTKVTALATNADKGCTIPATQQIGTYTLPSCMNTFVLAAGGSTATAADKKIAGCEVFLNCTGGASCF